MSKRFVDLPGVCPCFVRVEIDDSVSTKEEQEVARDLFDKNPRSYVVHSYNKHTGIADPKDVELS